MLRMSIVVRIDRDGSMIGTVLPGHVRDTRARPERMVATFVDEKTTASMQSDSWRASVAFTDQATIGTMGETTMSAVSAVARWRRAWEYMCDTWTDTPPIAVCVAFENLLEEV